MKKLLIIDTINDEITATEKVIEELQFIIDRIWQEEDIEKKLVEAGLIENKLAREIGYKNALEYCKELLTNKKI